MFKWIYVFLTQGYKTLNRGIFFKLVLLIAVPNMLMVIMINQLMDKQIEQKIAELNNTLLVLEHATNREIGALFNDVTTLTNQILIESEVQRILSASRTASIEKPNLPPEFINDRKALFETYDNQAIIRDLLSRYRLVRNNIYSIAIIDMDKGIYVNTGENYQIYPEDLSNSVLLKQVSLPNQAGLAWSVNDALTKNVDMITIARKIYGTNQPENVVGYVIVNLSLDAVRNSFETYNYFGDMIFGMINKSENTWMIYDNKRISGGYGKLDLNLHNNAGISLSNTTYNDKMWRTVMRNLDMGDRLFIGLNTQYIDKQANQFRNNMYFGYVFFLILAVFISLTGAKVLSQRIALIIKAMRQFGQENWGTRIHLQGKDEIRIIGDTFNSMAAHIEDLLHDVKEQQRLKRLFELRVLEYQINPHFLYNTLDSIHWMALDNNEPKISEMVNGLSKLFRIILNKGKETNTLQEEFDMIGIYMKIQKIRFEARFDYDIRLSPEISSYPIGKLVLQPLVENSIVHGIRRLRSKGIITVKGWRIDDDVVIEIADNGVGMDTEQVRKQSTLLNSDLMEEGVITSAGYGMKNVDSRLKLMFGDEYGLTICSERGPNGGTVIRIYVREAAMIKKQTTG
ncbi:Histidine kinase-, DNA gyrase B-, and HSP90-like ATPase [Paenibacillus sp. 1_12]|uniref:sensor histidine kinase n=1 Tax=Paenibacillus sp. 1_12 TaxID=1566278 RepID=UPI0008E796D6|nr:sensor histidine kinase [Paenibacillus sp. 1_12]SFL55529.1 Histidine kinase-, DNA gyrase B-, and HSP90-like ATPase [Paenibacillus sp. 1_12]